MDYNLTVTYRAFEETIAALEYYDHINPKLGTRFLTELSEIYERLSANPQFYSFVLSRRESNIRDVKLRSFPYVVIFEIRKKEVMVISVMNTHKKPFL